MLEHFYKYNVGAEGPKITSRVCFQDSMVDTVFVRDSAKEPGALRESMGKTAPVIIKKIC